MTKPHFSPLRGEDQGRGSAGPLSLGAPRKAPGLGNPVCHLVPGKGSRLTQARERQREQAGCRGLQGPVATHRLPRSSDPREGGPRSSHPRPPRGENSSASSELAQRQVAERGAQLRPPTTKADAPRPPPSSHHASHFLGFAPPPLHPTTPTPFKGSLGHHFLGRPCGRHLPRTADVNARSACAPLPLMTEPRAQVGSGCQLSPLMEDLLGHSDFFRDEPVTQGRTPKTPPHVFAGTMVGGLLLPWVGDELRAAGSHFATTREARPRRCQGEEGSGKSGLTHTQLSHLLSPRNRSEVESFCLFQCLSFMNAF